jgi:branched-subunit amino acid transport protein
MPDVLVVDNALDIFNPKLAAAIAVAIVALRWRNTWLPFIVGMAVLLGLRAI